MARHMLDAVAYGENADDTRRPDRPGALAAREHGVLRPLADAGLGKADVRQLARALRLPCADKPAAPAWPHASRTSIRWSPESWLRSSRPRQALRLARVSPTRGYVITARSPGWSWPTEDLPRAVSDPQPSTYWTAVQGAGFRFVALDLAGIQSGAFTLPLVTRRPGDGGG